MVELEGKPAARRGESGLDSEPSDKDCGERSEKILAHRVEEAEVLGEQIVDRLKDVLQEIGLHCRQLLRRRASVSARLRHAEVLKLIGDRSSHLGDVAGHAGLATDIGVDGAGGSVALLLREDGLLFEKRREELVRVLDSAEGQNARRIDLVQNGNFGVEAGVARK